MTLVQRGAAFQAFDEGLRVLVNVRHPGGIESSSSWGAEERADFVALLTKEDNGECSVALVKAYKPPLGA